MKGLSLKAVEAIERIVSERFDKVGMQFLGLVPAITKTKRIVFSSAKNSLTSLFLQALGTRNPNKNEEETLKVILRIANGYVDALKERTQARIVHDINAYIRDQNSKSKPVSLDKTKDIFRKEMDKAGKHFKLIANSESNKTTNVGTALQISKVAESQGVEDPTIFFIVHKDERNHPDTLRLHLLPDGITPRVWRLSELGSEYHKKGDPKPKIQGTHPFCRCKLTYLSKGFGFDSNGRVKYKGKEWNELKYQRDNFEIPKDESK